MDPDSYLDPDPTIFFIDLQGANKKLILFYSFFCLLLLEGTFTSFFKDKSQKESQNSRNQCFSYYFCLMIERSGAGSESGSIPLTNGSGSGEAQKHVDSDPDPQHCIQMMEIFAYWFIIYRPSTAVF
jgi:hypothetical protein